MKFLIKYLSKNRTVYLIIVLMAVLMSVTAIMKHRVYKSGGDLALFDQILRNTAHGKIGYNSQKQEIFFQEHSAFILIPLSVFYLIYDNPVTLLIIQSFFLIIPALPLYWIAKELTRNFHIAIALFTMYILSPYVWNAGLTDFHQETIAPLFFLLAFYFLIKNNWIGYSISIFLVLLCKEDMALYCIALGVFSLLFLKNKEIKIVGVVTIIISISYFLICMELIIKYYSKYSGHFTLESQYSYLGTNMHDIFNKIFKSPLKLIIQVITHIFRWEVIKSVFNIMVNSLFLPLFNLPVTLTLMILPVGVNILSDNHLYYCFQQHYSMPMVSFLYICSIYGLLKLIQSKINLISKIQLISRIIIIFAFINWVAIYPKLMFEYSKRTEHHRILDEFINELPENIKISAQHHIAPHLYKISNVYLYPVLYDADYLLFDVNINKFPFDDITYKRHLNSIKSNPCYKVVKQKDGILLIKKIGLR